MHIAAVLAVTLLNIHESARFKTGTFRFWGCLPVPESSAAEQKMQECLKVRLALEPLTCIRLALAWANHLPTFQHSMFLSPGIRPPSSESPPSSHSDTALIFLHTAARPPPPPPPSPQPSSPSPQLSATELSAAATDAIAVAAVAAANVAAMTFTAAALPTVTGRAGPSGHRCLDRARCHACPSDQWMAWPGNTRRGGEWEDSWPGPRGFVYASWKGGRVGSCEGSCEGSC